MLDQETLTQGYLHRASPALRNHSCLIYYSLIISSDYRPECATIKSVDGTVRMRTRRALLLALSGVRVKDQELLELGMTLPGFVERSEVIASLPSLGLLTLAAHTPEHWELEYLEVPDSIEDARVHALDGAFDVVAISSLTARILEAYDLADLLRASGLTVVIGGLHASTLPREALEHADAVVQGEGEAVWARLQEFGVGAAFAAACAAERDSVA